jgi:RND family efflux transporter MFP subunit
VTAFNTVTVRSRVQGELIEVLFKEGEQVKEDQLLAKIDPRSFEVALEQALGQQQQNESQYQNAKRDLQRYQALRKQDSIAPQMLDTQAALVSKFEGQLKSDLAAVNNARLQLDYTRITAPIAGRLGLRRVDAGNLINANDPLGLVDALHRHDLQRHARALSRRPARDAARSDLLGRPLRRARTRVLEEFQIGRTLPAEGSPVEGGVDAPRGSRARSRRRP